jgi:hypothetical protein
MRRTPQVRPLNLTGHWSLSPSLTTRPMTLANNRNTRSRAPALIASHTRANPSSATGSKSCGDVDFNPRIGLTS